MRISSIGIGATTTALINRVYLIYLWLFCSLVQAPLNRIGNSKITFDNINLVESIYHMMIGSYI